MKKPFIRGLLSAVLAASALPAAAADTDLYVIGSPKADLPNVLFVIDNTANWGGKDTDEPFATERKALIETFKNIPENQFNVGIVFATEPGDGTNSNGAGGYVRAAARTMNSTNKLLYAELAASFGASRDKGSGGASAMQIAEVYYYLAGLAPYSGNKIRKADYTGNSSGGTKASNDVYAQPGNALSSWGATKYNTPILEGGCGQNYIIYISNGPNQQSASLDTKSNQMLKDAGGDTTMIPLSPSGSQSNPMDEWVRHLNKKLGVVTHVIDVNPKPSGQGPGWTELLKSMKTVGQGTYTAVDTKNGGGPLLEAITGTLSKIQSVNSVFAAVSLPASANVQGAYLNQLYVGMFRPDEQTKPRWLGNLKQYQLNQDKNLADADMRAAINSKTGFIDECARSFWTPPKDMFDDYWANAMRGACIPPTLAGKEYDKDLYARSNTPDGNVVEKGAQAYVMRKMTPASRVVKTCSADFASCNQLVEFNTTTVPAAQLGVTDTTEHSALIQWAKGQNVDAELDKTTTEMRPSVHGDVVHSAPLALSYGQDVVVFYGSNDGMLHAVNGNQTRNLGTVPPGGELWAFMPPEMFGHLKRLRANTPLLRIAKPVGEEQTGMPKPYGIDGPISVYRDSANTWIYTTMRRGGRALYAFKVTNPATPELAWKVGCPNLVNDDNCTTGLSRLGQTWSAATPLRVPGHASGSKPVLVMGGGYDDCEDSDPNTCTPTSKGNGIFVLDGFNGTVLKTLTTDRGVVGEVKFVPGSNGMARYGYAADLGGNVYRITIDNFAPADWTITKIASLGCSTTASCTNNRKFMFGPSVVPDTDGSYNLFIGTGDREKPLNSSYYPNANSVANYFFKIKDYPASPAWLESEVANCGSGVICLASLSDAGTTANNCSSSFTNTPGSKGWTLGMRPSEQVVTSAATRFGSTTFSTHIPATTQANSCTSNLGTTHVYNLDINTARPRSGTSCSDTVAGGGLPPPPSKKDVCIGGSSCTAICIGCTTASPIETSEDIPIKSLIKEQGKRRVYWYLDK